MLVVKMYNFTSFTSLDTGKPVLTAIWKPRSYLDSVTNIALLGASLKDGRHTKNLIPIHMEHKTNTIHPTPFVN